MILQETSTATEPGCCIMIGQYMYGKIDAFHKQLIYQASIIEKCMMSTNLLLVSGTNVVNLVST